MVSGAHFNSQQGNLVPKMVLFSNSTACICSFHVLTVMCPVALIVIPLSFHLRLVTKLLTVTMG